MTARGALSRLSGHLIGLALLAGMAAADPALPQWSSRVASLEFGVFCAEKDMNQIPAPGTLSGWLNVPDGDVAFHWPDRRVVPASLGLGFGVRVRLSEGAAPFAEIRVYRPGRDLPETWGSSLDSLGESISFFAFETEDELIPGLWRFEAWDAREQLLSVEFEVVPAADLPEIAGACGAVA